MEAAIVLDDHATVIEVGADLLALSCRRHHARRHPRPLAQKLGVALQRREIARGVGAEEAAAMVIVGVEPLALDEAGDEVERCPRFREDALGIAVAENLVASGDDELLAAAHHAAAARAGAEAERTCI